MNVLIFKTLFTQVHFVFRIYVETECSHTHYHSPIHCSVRPNCGIMIYLGILIGLIKQKFCCKMT